VRHDSLIITLVLASATLLLVVVAATFESVLVAYTLGAILVLLLLLSWSTGVPIEGRRHRHGGHWPRTVGVEDEDEDRRDSAVEPGGLTGVWSGTARVWPVDDGDVLRVFPVHLAISEHPAQARLLNDGATAGRDGHAMDPADGRVTGVCVLEHDEAGGHLDLRVDIEQAGRQEEYVTQLSAQADRLVTEDDTDTFTLELVPQA
jgi:hypothetical protein